MKGRKLGTIDVSINEMKTIVKMTNDNASRSEIADAVGRCPDTVWRYQKKLDLI